MLSSLITNSCFMWDRRQERPLHKTVSFVEIRAMPNLIRNACKLSQSRSELENNPHHCGENTYMQTELHMHKFKFSVWHTLLHMQKTIIVWQNKGTVSKGTMQIQIKTFKTLVQNPTWTQMLTNTNYTGDTIGLHFANVTHKGTLDFQIQILDCSAFPKTVRELQNWELPKEKFWINSLRCSAPQGLNIME